MCGRFVLEASIEELKAYYKAYSSIDLHANYNITPQSEIPALVYSEKHKRLEIHLFRWGLIPIWSKDINIAQKLINARAETIEVKPSFRNSFKKRKCIIPASGFYEWQNETKQPYYIKPEEKLFSFAGIWDRWKANEDRLLLTCAIVTREAGSNLSHIHERVPVILDETQFDTWLDPLSNVEELKLITSSPQKIKIDFKAIDRRVNNPANNDITLIKPGN